MDTFQDLKERIPKGGTIDELIQNLKEVIEMLLENGEPVLESEFIGIQNVKVGI